MMHSMKSFRQFLAEEGFTHSTHLEDLIMVKGQKGVATALSFIDDVVKQLGSSSNERNPGHTIKWDGAPAVIAGWHADRFFVATKSLFNKDPKVNYTVDDIARNHPGELGEKLKECLTLLSSIVPKGRILQGDLMFGQGDKKIQTIDGEKYITFHPNTILYAVPVSSALGGAIGNASLGIVFHTEYQNAGHDVLAPKLVGHNVRVNGFKHNPKVWCIDAYHHDFSGLANFTAAETKSLEGLRSRINKLSSSFKWAMLKDQETTQYLMTYLNTYYRMGMGIEGINPRVMAADCYKWLAGKMSNDVDSKKSVKGKEAALSRWNTTLSKIPSEADLEILFALYQQLTFAKNFIVHKLDAIQSVKTFLKRSDGSIVVTGTEGFVGCRGDFSGVKLVDRLEFSRANFSADILKGWQSDSRR